MNVCNYVYNERARGPLLGGDNNRFLPNIAFFPSAVIAAISLNKKFLVSTMTSEIAALALLKRASYNLNQRYRFTPHTRSARRRSPHPQNLGDLLTSIPAASGRDA